MNVMCMANHEPQILHCLLALGAGALPAAAKDIPRSQQELNLLSSVCHADSQSGDAASLQTSFLCAVLTKASLQVQNGHEAGDQTIWPDQGLVELTRKVLASTPTPPLAVSIYYVALRLGMLSSLSP